MPTTPVQVALLTAWREIRALRDPELFEPWLHRILTHPRDDAREANESGMPSRHTQ